MWIFFVAVDILFYYCVLFRSLLCTFLVLSWLCDTPFCCCCCCCVARFKKKIPHVCLYVTLYILHLFWKKKKRKEKKKKEKKLKKKNSKKKTQKKTQKKKTQKKTLGHDGYYLLVVCPGNTMSCGRVWITRLSKLFHVASWLKVALF